MADPGSGGLEEQRDGSGDLPTLSRPSTEGLAVTPMGRWSMTWQVYFPLMNYVSV